MTEQIEPGAASGHALAKTGAQGHGLAVADTEVGVAEPTSSGQRCCRSDRLQHT